MCTCLKGCSMARIGDSCSRRAPYTARIGKNPVFLYQEGGFAPTESPDSCHVAAELCMKIQKWQILAIAQDGEDHCKIRSRFPRGSRRRRLDCSLVTLASHASPPAAQIEPPRGSRVCAPSPARPPNRLGCSRVAIPSHIAQAATEPQHHAPGRPARGGSRRRPARKSRKSRRSRPPGRPACGPHPARGPPSSARTSSRRR